MTKTIILLLAICAFASCTSKRDKLQKNIIEEEKIVTLSMNDVFDKSTAEILRKDYLKFANEFPEDTLSPIYMHKAAELAINLEMPQDAVLTIDSLIIRYKNYKRMPDVIFFKGFIQENYIGDKAAAKQTYEEFLQKFPTDSMASQVKFSLDNMDKSAEDILKMFEERNKQTDTVTLFPETSK